MDPVNAILDGVEFGPHSAKSLRNWLSGLKAASAVTFCRDDPTDELDEAEVNTNDCVKLHDRPNKMKRRSFRRWSS